MTSRMLALPSPPRKAEKPQARKRLWELDARFLCPLIGLCLNRAELRRLAKERVYAVDAAASDYQLHSAFVGMGRKHDQRAKALNKYLEKKYRPALRRYAQAQDDQALRELWRQDCAGSREGQAWWHLLTHPAAGVELLEELYGELHMLGHEAAALLGSERARHAALQERLDMLEEILASEREAQRRERSRFDASLSELHAQLAAQSELEWENQELARENERLRGREEKIINGTLLQESREESASLQEENRHLRAEHAKLAAELGAYRQLAAKAAEREQGYIAQLDTLKMQQRELLQELAAAEQQIVQQAMQEESCGQCGQCGASACPGAKLCGKRVLYVGGHHKMVAHYRRVVEAAGASFLHHDGGVESARSHLPKMLSSADAVMCPVDCVSHDACICVKKMCKRFNKPCVLMRSSGLSSLARGLDELVQ